MSSALNKRVLPVAEWFAENAYISPGKHRFYTALGLMTGLYLGRETMNILTGVNADDEEIDRDRLAPPLKRFHGMLAYNRYEDSPEAKWHRVADAFVPLFFGAAGAMAGSSAFARNTEITTKLMEELRRGSTTYQIQHADMLANKVQSKVLIPP
jgi:hypothetical protein